jgi:hypothetical protein
MAGWEGREIDFAAMEVEWGNGIVDLDSAL